MKKLREKLIIRSSSRRPRASDIAPSDVASGSLAQPSSASPAALNPGDAKSEPQNPLKQSRSNPVDSKDPSQKLDYARSPKNAKGEIASPGIDGVLPSSLPPTSLAGAVKDEKVDSGQNDASSTLNSSPLWQRAMEMVKTGDEWTRYIDIVTRNAASKSSDVNSPERIVAIAEKIADQLQTSKTTLKLGGRTIVIRDVLNNVLDALSVIKDVGSSLTSLNPYASVAWGGLQFFVQAAVNNKEVGALCWDELPRMLRLMSQYQTFETLYDVSKLKKTKIHLEEALVQLFSTILRYQVVIVKYASSRTDRFKAAFQGKLASMPQQVLDEIKQAEGEVAKIQTLADREMVDTQFQFLTDSSEVNIQHLEEISAELRQSNFRAQELGTKTVTYIESVSELLETTRRDNILAWISTIAHRDVHNSRERKAMKGTGQWLVQHPEYIRWRSSKQAAVLWLHGLMGSGKSCLTHTVIEDVKFSSSGLITQKLAYFYCNGSSEQGRRDIENADNILRCLLKQLSCVSEDGRLMNNIINMYDSIHVEGRLSDDQCEDLIRSLVDESETTTIVIDGLDECSHEVQKILMASIAGLLEGCLGPLQIFVSSRRNDDIVDLLQDLPVTEIDMADNNTEDIEIYVRRTAHEAASRPGDRRKYQDVKGDRSQEDAVVSRLLGKAGGMFRWVELAFKFLHDSVDYDAMSNRLDQLSHLGQLFDLYDKIYDEMMRQIDTADQARIKTLLTFMVHGMDTPLEYLIDIRKSYPQEIQEIAHILEACEFSTAGDLCMRPMSVERVGTLCPSLVVVTRGRCYGLAFPHVSVREWLLSGSRQSSLYVTNQGHCYLAQLCMKVICASGKPPKGSLDKVEDPEAGPAESTKLTALQQYSSRGWLDHLNSPITQYEPLCPLNKIWLKETALRTALESFLFDMDKQAPVWPNTLVTGFQLWHMLCRRQIGNDTDDDGEEEEEEENVILYHYSGKGMLPETLLRYILLPAGLILPASICALVGHYCNLSSFQEAAMGVAVDPYDWRVRSLAAVMVIDDIEASKWIIAQTQPSSSPGVLTDALLLTVTLGYWPDFDENDAKGWEQEIHARAWLPQLVRLLVASGVDVNERHGPSGTPLLVRLIRAWVFSEHRVSTAAAIITASFIDLGADALVPVEFESEAGFGKIYELVFANLDVSELKTVLDWILLWGVQPETVDVEAHFLTQQWDKSVWTRWLTLAVRDPDCSPNLVQSCLRNGADPLTTAGDTGLVYLGFAIAAGCSGLVLDILSAATFSANADLHVDIFDPHVGDYLPRIIAKCSRNTIKLWNDRGANIAGIDLTEMPWYWNSPLQIVKERTKTTGDPSAEEYLRSLGITTPTRTLSASASMNSTSAQMGDPESDDRGESASSRDDSDSEDGSTQSIPEQGSNGGSNPQSLTL